MAGIGKVAEGVVAGQIDNPVVVCRVAVYDRQRLRSRKSFLWIRVTDQAGKHITHSPT
jgi:hypothetical protein